MFGRGVSTCNRFPWSLITTSQRKTVHLHVISPIHHSLVSNRENYIHRIGRSGRFGRKGVAINVSRSYNFWPSGLTCSTISSLSPSMTCVYYVTSVSTRPHIPWSMCWADIFSEQFYGTQIVSHRTVDYSQALIFLQDEMPVNAAELI